VNSARTEVTAPALNAHWGLVPQTPIHLSKCEPVDGIAVSATRAPKGGLSEHDDPQSTDPPPCSELPVTVPDPDPLFRTRKSIDTKNGGAGPDADPNRTPTKRFSVRATHDAACGSPLSSHPKTQVTGSADVAVSARSLPGTTLDGQLTCPVDDAVASQLTPGPVTLPTPAIRMVSVAGLKSA
jgi:hypothetical protein